MNSGREMLQNTPKLHFGSNGSYLVCSFENVRRNFGTQKQYILVRKRTSFSLFCMNSGSQLLQNTPKHRLGSNGGYLVCSSENVRRNFGTQKQYILVPKRTSFSFFSMNSGSQMLQNTPKHRFGSNGGYLVCSSENVRRNFGTPKQCILVPKRTCFSS